MNEEEQKVVAEAAPSTSTEETIDYEAIALAEKARADAAEALIIKNKNLAKRHEADETALTEERVLELIQSTKESADTSEEAQALAAAQQAVRELTAKKAEVERALAAKKNAGTDIASTQRDGLPPVEPKLPANSPLRDYKHEGNGIYSKKLASGKTMFVNTKAIPGRPKNWIV